MNQLGKISKIQLATTDAVLQALVNDAIKITKQDFGIIEGGGKRTKTEQYNLFRRGYSRCDGTKKISKHQSGLAVDLVPYTDGNYRWADVVAFDIIHTAVMQAWNDMKCTDYKLIWGGDWKTFYDPAHYELRAN